MFYLVRVKVDWLSATDEMTFPKLINIRLVYFEYAYVLMIEYADDTMHKWYIRRYFNWKQIIWLLINMAENYTNFITTSDYIC